MSTSKIDKKGPNLKWGYITRSGEFAIPPRFDEAESFSNGQAYVSIGDAQYVIDRTGQVIKQLHPEEPEPDYEEIPWEESWAAVRAPRRHVLDPKWKLVIVSRVVSAEGLVRANVGGKPDDFGLAWGGRWGYVDQNNRFVIEPVFTGALDFSDGLAAVAVGGKQDEMGCVRGGKWGYINAEGKFVAEPQFSRACTFSEGLAAVIVGGRFKKYWHWHDTSQTGTWGFVDRTGKLAVAPQFEWVDNEFHEGLVRVVLGGKYGYLDNTGNYAIKPQFAWAWRFSEGLAAVAVEAVEVSQ